MIALLLQFGPWILGAVGVIVGLLSHWRSTAKVAAADQKVAEAQTGAAEAQTRVAQVQDAAAQANATAAQAGAQASKERENVENNVTALPAGGAAQQLRDGWSRD
ncbi:MAG: hypothetical protein PW735_01690 [Acidobacteriaceae bacterium]|nr:hypothetical protein [Acidobacteriaceae bacterium]